jgi:transcriptional regulator with XRE-family HTH domain
MSKSLAEIKAGLPENVLKMAADRAAELRTEIEGLQPLRQALEQTQVALAERMQVSQASIAKIEQRTDVLLSTLRHYVQGLGGELSLVASFPGRPDIRITGFGDISNSTNVSKRGRSAMATSDARHKKRASLER